MKSLTSLIAELHRESQLYPAELVSFAKTERWSNVDFIMHVTRLAEELSHNDAKNWLLCFDCAYRFAIGFFAALISQKQLALPQNYSSNTLSHFSQQDFGILSDRAQSLSSWKAEKLDLRTLPSYTSTEFTLIQSTHPLAFEPIEQSSILLFTSGSAGEPKICQKNLELFEKEVVRLENNFADQIADSIFLSSVSPQHIYGLLFRVLWPLSAGRAFASFQVEHPEMLLYERERNERCAFISSPAFLGPASEFPRLQKDRTLTVFSSGGPLREGVVKNLQETWGMTPIEVYGSTETGGIAWRKRDFSDDSCLEESSWWKIFPGVAISTTENHTLRIASPLIHHSLLSGDDAWFETNDVVESKSPSQFVLLKRNDRIVKVGEKRVSLCDLEERLGQHAFVSSVKTLLLEDTTLGQNSRPVLGAVVVLNKLGRENLSTFGRFEISELLRHFLASDFDRVALPKYWRFPSALPLNPQGKTPHDVLLRLFQKKVKEQPCELSQGPILLSQDHSSTWANFELSVPHRLGFLSGHFPGNPLVPGFVLFEWARSLTESLFGPAHNQELRVTNLKFLRPLRAGEITKLCIAEKHLSKENDSSRKRSFTFSYEKEGAVISSGGFSFL